RYYQAVPGIVQEVMDRFTRQTGRSYRLFEYVGHPEAERLIVLMGSGAETVQETVEYLNARGEKLGLLKVRLYRPFSVPDFVATRPPRGRSLAGLDRTRERGAVGEPLYQDVVTALAERMKDEGGRMNQKDSGSSFILHPSSFPTVIGGRYGLSSKEFTPAMV